MSDKVRIKIAAAVTALFLAAISAAGVVVHGTGAATALPSNATASAQPPGHGQLHLVPTPNDQEYG